MRAAVAPVAPVFAAPPSGFGYQVQDASRGRRVGGPLLRRPLAVGPGRVPGFAARRIAAMNGVVAGGVVPPGEAATTGFGVRGLVGAFRQRLVMWNCAG